MKIHEFIKLINRTILDLEKDLYNNMISKDLDIIEFRFFDLGKTDYLENDYIISLKSKDGSEKKNNVRKDEEIKKEKRRKSEKNK